MTRADQLQLGQAPAPHDGAGPELPEARSTLLGLVRPPIPAMTDIRRRGLPAPHEGQVASSTFADEINVSNSFSQLEHLNS